MCPKQFQFKTNTLNKAELSVSNIESTSLTGETITSQNISSSSSLLVIGESVLMQTAIANLKNPLTQDQVSSRIFFDSGSQRSYITEAKMKELKLQPVSRQNLILFTFASSKSKKLKTPVVELDLYSKEGEFLHLTFSVVPKITENFIRLPITNLDNLELLHRYTLADIFPQTIETVSVDVLIGNDYYWDLVESNKIQVSPGLYLIDSKLGLLLSGRVKSDEETSTELSVFGKDLALTNFTFQPVLEDRLSDFWNLEHIGIKDSAVEMMMIKL